MARTPSDPHAYALDSTRCLVMADERENGGWCPTVAEDLRQALQVISANVESLAADECDRRECYADIREAIARINDHAAMLNGEVK